MMFSLSIYLVTLLLIGFETLVNSEENVVSSPGNSTIICYYTNWSSLRHGIGRFMPENIDYSYCTHIVYISTHLNNDTLNEIVPGIPKLDIEHDHYGMVTSLKSYGKRVILGLGGWADSTPKYSQMLKHHKLRTMLVSQIADYVIKYEFDGLDVRINYPGAYQGDMNSSNADDKQFFLMFLQALREEFDRKSQTQRLSLSVTGAPFTEFVERGYDVPAIAKVVDWIEVRLYDLHGYWEPRTGLVSPFSSQPGDEKVGNTYNVQTAMKLWLDKGATANKLVLGIPLYGRTFVLTDNNSNGINAPASGLPEVGEYTKHEGYLAFYEIVNKVAQNNWTVIHEEKIGSYAFRDNQWVGFDDKVDVAIKAAYVKENNFLGVSVWSLDLDCFQEDCLVGKYPLLSTIYNILNGNIMLHAVKNAI